MQRRDARSGLKNDRLLSRLNRCEALLQTYGVKIEDDYAIGDKDSPRDAPAAATGSDDGQIIVGQGQSRYVENNLWRGLRSELQDVENMPEVAEDDSALLTEEFSSGGESLIFGQQITPSLSMLHPSVPQIFGLWQACLQNVNPLVKLFHAPSVQQTLLEAITDLGNISKNTEALMFAIYLSSVASMNDQDCKSLMGESKPSLLAKFSNLTQRALVNAEFLKSSNLVLLQAFTLYLLATRQVHDPQSLWLLTGLANRTGQTMGLHRERSLRGLSPFDTEIRRRLWWQILIMDSRSAQLSGAAIDAHFHLFWDTKRPLNVNDSDLSPSMSELPPEYDGLTEMLFCSIRFEIGDCMRQLKIIEKNCGTMSGLAIIAQQGQAINELENLLEQGYLKKCDPSIPFHLLAIHLARSSICHMRLSAHHPRQYPDKGAGLSQEEKDKLFALGLQVVAYDNLTYSTKSLEGYLWHVVMNFPFEAFILVLTELITRVEGETVDRAWMHINQACEDHPELFTEPKNALYYAMGNLTLKAWEKRVAAARDKRPPYQPVEPPSIFKLRAQRNIKALQTTETLYTNAMSPNSLAAQGSYANSIRGDVSGSLELQFPMNTADWDYDGWQNLFDGRGDPFFDGYEQ